MERSLSGRGHESSAHQLFVAHRPIITFFSGTEFNRPSKAVVISLACLPRPDIAGSTSFTQSSRVFTGGISSNPDLFALDADVGHFSFSQTCGKVNPGVKSFRPLLLEAFKDALARDMPNAKKLRLRITLVDSRPISLEKLPAAFPWLAGMVRFSPFPIFGQCSVTRRDF